MLSLIYKFLGALGLLLLAMNATYAQVTLSLHLNHGEPEIGYLLGEDGKTLLWFALTSNRPTILSGLPAGKYDIDLTCSEAHEPHQHLALQGRADVRFRHIAGFVGRAESLHIENANITPNTCKFKDLTLPLLTSAGTALTTSQLLKAVATSVPQSDSQGSFEIRSGTEAFLTLLISIQRKRLEQDQDQNSERIKDLLYRLASAAPSEDLKQLRIPTELRDESGKILLGLLTMTSSTTEISDDTVGRINVEYLSSHEGLRSESTEVRYELDVEPLAPAKEDLVNVTREQADSSIQVLPFVHPAGKWGFKVSPLEGFKECRVQIQYHLRRLQPGSPAKEIASGKLSEGAYFRTKPGLTLKEKAKQLVSDFGGLIGWCLATLLGSLQLYDWLRKKKRYERILKIRALREKKTSQKTQTTSSGQG
ncbi:MAG TPA: hypothetical protein VKD65_09060 [Candidatus Angelobacter sp.]|nr:hypothetical protein [Candidatus Angelobacter sp.]